MRCLGLDIGSSSIKGAVLELDQERVGDSRTRPFPPPVSGRRAGWYEIAPEAILEQVRQVIHDLLELAPDAVGLFCSGQMGGVILVDETGRPLSNYLSWRDQRTLEEVAEGKSLLQKLREQWQSGILVELGNELQPGSTTSLLYWLAQHDALPAQAMPVTVADFVLGQMCQSVPSMHVTHAIGMLNLHKLDWHLDAFSALGMHQLRLPRLAHQPEHIGVCTLKGRQLQVYGSFGDQQCALRGAGLRQGELSLNISTGSQVSQRVTQFVPGQYQTRGYFEGDLLNTVTHLPAGRSLNVLVDLLTELATAEGVTLQRIWANIIEKAAAVETTDLQADLAFFAGPVGSAGSVSHITTENLTVGHLFHAAFRSMADNYARFANQLDAVQDWDSVVLSGGLTQAVPLLRSLLQERFPVPFRESTGDETLTGLMHIARSQRVSFPEQLKN